MYFKRRQKEEGSTEIFNNIIKRKKCEKEIEVRAVRYAYLVKIEVIPDMKYREMFENVNITKDKIDDNGQADSIFSATLTNELNLPIYLINDKTYGQIVNIKEIAEDKLHPELTRIMENHDLWEKRYIQEKVSLKSRH